jgi:hypothetical protein
MELRLASLTMHGCAGEPAATAFLKTDGVRAARQPGLHHFITRGETMCHALWIGRDTLLQVNRAAEQHWSTILCCW